MQIRVSVLVLLLSSVAWANEGSPFRSSVPGIDIANAHLVEHEQGTVYRGSAPGGQVGELAKFGFTDVLIFKNDLHGEVAAEKSALIASGIPGSHIQTIPFRWNQLPPFREACRETVSALQFVMGVLHTPGRTGFFHCTMGEDRTGFLAGLTRLLVDRWDTRRAFDQEMCRNGYEAGNPRKPQAVVRAVRSEITPLYLRLAALIEQGKLSESDLDALVC
ncbi:MAG: hypothetical protein ACXWPM_11360, partial [Bdellovibrionota bacterium]